MTRGRYYSDLAAARTTAAAAAGWLRESADFDQHWLRTAETDLTSMDRQLTAAAEPRYRLRLPTVILIAVGVAAAVATSVRALGFPAFWIIACAWLAADLTNSAFSRWPARRVAAKIGRWRLDRRRVPTEPVAPGDLAGLLRELRRARVRLVAAGLREAGPAGAYLAQIAPREHYLYAVVIADVMLCQAIDHIDLYRHQQTTEEA